MTAIKRFAFLIALFLLFLSSSFAREVVPELTPAQKEADFIYLTGLMRDLYPFAEFNVQYKKLHNIIALDQDYINRAKKTKNNIEFYRVFREYLFELAKTGHAYVHPPEVVKGMDNPETRQALGLKGDIYSKALYWSTIEQGLFVDWFAHTPIDILYRDGNYVIMNEVTLSGKTLQAGTVIQKVEGLSPDEYVLSLQNKTWLAFDAKNRKLYLPDLFVVNPGAKKKGWKVSFRLPNGKIFSGLVPKFSGAKQHLVFGYYPNAYCQELDAEVGYLKISSFSGEFLSKDWEAIQKFINDSQGKYRKLIIDVRNNGGGDPINWMDNLIAPLLKSAITYEETALIRKPLFDGTQEKNKIYLEQLRIYLEQRLELISEKYHVMSVEELSELPGFSKDDWLFFKVTRKIEPKNSLPFNGQIYLMTNQDCFSATEDFATAVKRTGFAKIVGTNTSGGAASFVAPVTFALPESNIVFRMEAEATLNPDGTPNEIFGTAPDVWLQPALPATDYKKETLLQDPWIKWILADQL
ncbi:MAG TPA: S41 family peptidase [Bacillota bacterium]|nr:S41 family peptidase [Bacillota bacterium]